MVLGVQESTMSIEDRQEYIEIMIRFTKKTQEYWDKCTDREIIEAYDRLMKLD